MDESKPIPARRDELLLVYNLDRTIEFARLRCLPRERIIEQALNMDNDNLDAYIYRLKELEPTPSEFEFIADTMCTLASASEMLPQKRN